MIVILAISGAFGLLLYAFGILQFSTRAARSTRPGDRRLEPGRSPRHRPGIANCLRQRRLPCAFGRAPAPATCVRSNGCSPARRRVGVCLSPVTIGEIRRARERGPSPLAAAERSGRRRLVPHSGSPARGRRQGRPHGVDRLGRDARHRPARDLFPGPSARDRLSRSRAGRLFLSRARRFDRAYERHLGRLARLRSRPVQRRPAQD